MHNKQSLPVFFLMVTWILSACNQAPTVETPRLVPPTNFLAKDISSTSATLFWEASPNAKRYLLERVVAINLLVDGNYIKIAEVTGTSYLDTALEPQTNYSYRLRALRDHEESESVDQLVLTQPDKPGRFRLEVADVTLSTVRLVWSWPASSKELASVVGTFVIERKTPPGGYEILAELPADEPDAGYQGFYLDEKLSPTTHYSYRVTAVNATGVSEPQEVTTTTRSK